MIVTAIKTKRIEAGKISFEQLLDNSIKDFSDGGILAVTSKVIALCENRVVKADQADKTELVKNESQLYLPPNRLGFSFSITQNTLIPSAGIDQSNTGGDYVLWPADPQKTANEIRQYLKKRFNLNQVGVVITDSSVAVPLRWGTIGIALAYSGFKPTKDYRGQPDLFGRPFTVSQSAIAGSLSTAAVLVMGEGTEQTPLAIIKDVPFVEFQDRDPTNKELQNFSIGNKNDDLFAPFLNAVKWQKGNKE